MRSLNILMKMTKYKSVGGIKQNVDFTNKIKRLVISYKNNYKNKWKNHFDFIKLFY